MSMKRASLVSFVVLALTAIVLAGCGRTEQPATSPIQEGLDENVGQLTKTSPSLSITPAMLDAINAAFEAEGKPHRVGWAETIVELRGQQTGITIYAKDVGNKQKDADFVPFDPRRVPWSGPIVGGTDDITYAIDQRDAKPSLGGLSAAQTTAAIVAAMQTWDQVDCSTIPLTRVSDGGKDLGYAAAELGMGGSKKIMADIMHAGFKDIDFGDYVLGVTFTYFFAGGSGVSGEPSIATDIDNNGKLDVAFREIYYDRGTIWKLSPTQQELADYGWMDVQSIALHEAGHGLSQAHFGFVFVTDANGQAHLSPLAVMNAVYTGTLQELQGSDIAGHCSNWSAWPNN
jgi:hypothetical protein